MRQDGSDVLKGSEVSHAQPRRREPQDGQMKICAILRVGGQRRGRGVQGGGRQPIGRRETCRRGGPVQLTVMLG